MLKMRQFRSHLTLATVLLLFGCGLDSYEERMDIARVRMKTFDAEDKALDGPIENPVVEFTDPKTKTVQELPVWPSEVFLRAPKGFQTSRPHKDDKGAEGEKEGKTFFRANSLSLYRYPRPLEKNDKGPNVRYSLFVASSKVGEQSKTGTFNPGELSPEEFRRQVTLDLQKYYRAEFKSDISFPDSKLTDKDLISIQPESGKLVRGKWVADPALEYHKLVFKDDPKKPKAASNFLLFFHRQKEGSARQAALVFQVPDADNIEPELKFNMDYCLKSLDISDKAPEKKQEYLATRKASSGKS